MHGKVESNLIELTFKNINKISSSVVSPCDKKYGSTHLYPEAEGVR